MAIKSKAYSLTREDLARVCRNGLIMFTPVILVFLTQIENNTYDTKILLSMIVAILIDTTRRYIRQV